MTSDQLVAAIITAWPLAGAVGTGLRTVGNVYAKPKLVAIGARLEATFLDAPKLIKGEPKK
jgi:hypothetical protein